MEHTDGQIRPGQEPSEKRPRKFNSEKSMLKLSDTELESLAFDLNFLGSNFDPFEQKISPEFQKLIRKLDLELFLADPFQFTNIILKRLDQIETELKKRKH